eukprot:4821092-Ditylum_brightwellii.AAC.1
MDVDYPACTTFEVYDMVPEMVPVGFMARSVVYMVEQMRWSAGPMGIDVVALSNCLLCFGMAPEELREEIALLADILEN